jgi:hypothetical protein
MIIKGFKYFLFGSFSDKKLYFLALIWSMFTRFFMLYIPFKYYRRYLGEMQQLNNFEATESQLQEAINIKVKVLLVCKNTPWESKCLVQAVTCKQLLLKKGIHTNLFLGVWKDENATEMKAHAWLKLGDVILTGKHGHQKFKVVNFFG